ncbi:MAG TPA: hypothetical protein VGK17_10460 [Propionicimonas sp.]
MEPATGAPSSSARPHASRTTLIVVLLAAAGWLISGYLAGAIALVWALVIFRRDRRRSLALLILTAALLLFAAVFQALPPIHFG